MGTPSASTSRGTIKMPPPTPRTDPRMPIKKPKNASREKFRKFKSNIKTLYRLRMLAFERRHVPKLFQPRHPAFGFTLADIEGTRAFDAVKFQNAQVQVRGRLDIVHYRLGFNKDARLIDFLRVYGK